MAEAKKKLKAELKAYQKKGIELQLGKENCQSLQYRRGGHLYAGV